MCSKVKVNQIMRSTKLTSKPCGMMGVRNYFKYFKGVRKYFNGVRFYFNGVRKCFKGGANILSGCASILTGYGRI